MSDEVDESLLREIERLRARSKNVRFEELRRLWERAGGEAPTPPRGSHYRFTMERRSLTVPYRRPHVLQVYVLRVLSVIEECVREQD
jgi:hypothetical protein